MQTGCPMADQPAWQLEERPMEDRWCDRAQWQINWTSQRWEFHSNHTSVEASGAFDILGKSDDNCLPPDVPVLPTASTLKQATDFFAGHLHSFIQQSFAFLNPGSSNISKEPESPTLSLGERVVWLSDNGPHAGTVRWIGRIPFICPGWTVGVQFDEAIGRGDGVFGGRRYFNAPSGHACFIPALGLLQYNNIDNGENPNLSPLKSNTPLKSKNQMFQASCSKASCSFKEEAPEISGVRKKCIRYDSRLNSCNKQKKRAPPPPIHLPKITEIPEHNELSIEKIGKSSNTVQDFIEAFNYLTQKASSTYIERENASDIYVPKRYYSKLYESPIKITSTKWKYTPNTSKNHLDITNAPNIINAVSNGDINLILNVNENSDHEKNLTISSIITKNTYPRDLNSMNISEKDIKNVIKSSKVYAAESHRILVEVYGDHGQADRASQKWFVWFKSGNFDLEDEERPGVPPNNFSSLKRNGNESKYRKLVSYELKTRDVERRFSRVKNCSNVEKERGFCIELQLAMKSGFITIIQNIGQCMDTLAMPYHRQPSQIFTAGRLCCVYGWTI
ncbi:CYLD [Cordylochernes scorpioides]|uniref:CYLD n=1 Tax=Cordylochernes scorpioides TaxID=51811 RepID=A0ABY6LST3_9ARAC|nr:CYLD [Cordylochernes scorpioides]